MQTRVISVLGASATIPQPYEEGQTINAAEAKALNQYFAEGISNNTRSKVKDLIPEGAEGLTEEGMTQAVALIEEYAGSYEITLASSGGSKAKMDPIEKEAHSIASDLIKAELKKQGKLLKDVDKDAFNEKVAQIAQNEKVLAQAKKTVEARAKASTLEVDVTL